MTTPLEKLFACADNHAEDSGEPDHAVGDLQDLLREAWGSMTLEQQHTLLRSDTVANVLDTGSRDEFTADTLVDELVENLKTIAKVVAAHGYKLKTGPAGIYWTKDAYDSRYYLTEDDAVISAHSHLLANPEGAK